ncbi:MAG: Chemotaxis protein PomA [Alphaproteobacteria bacterium MarineAlpha4_Bin2]|nr:MAG: Chemotaxis protein PomA [Alphaproteobacteria bacterium MarineAlpha4_Bin2]
MSFGTIGGIVGGFGLIIMSILLETTKFGIFVSFSSLLMVVGGTVAGILIGQEARYVILALKGVIQIYMPQKAGRNTLLDEVGQIIEWSYIVQKDGVVKLEQEAEKVQDDPLMKFGMNVILAGHKGETVRAIMQNFADNAYTRRNVQVSILNTMASLAPAFGMVGTLVGLIIMLANMGADPAALGAGLAIALNTTLYGVIVAKMFFGPAATKLDQRYSILYFIDEIKVEGLALLADSTSPREIQDRLNSYLDPAIHFDIDEQLNK